MPVKATPLKRQEVETLLVTDADAFTVLRYLRHREDVPSLPDLEERGQKTLPGVEGMLCDLYHTLWNPEPGVKDEVAADRRYWQELLGQTVKSSAYEEFHSQTQLKELESVLGTIAMGESVLTMVPKEDQQKLQELAEAQQKANQAGQQATEAQANAQASQQLADAAQAGGQSEELAQQASQAQAEAQAAQMNFEQAKAKANELAEQLMGKPGTGQAQKRSEQLRRMGMAAAKRAQAKVQEVSETLQSWGLEPGELTRESFAEVEQILAALKRNPRLKKFAELLGRVRKIAARKAKQKIAGEGARVTAPETGRDIKRVHSSELVALVSPALRVKALTRWARGELRLHGQQVRQKLGHGPVVVCEDASGSMEGVKQQWTKALVLALAHYAKLQKRSFGWVMFDTYPRVTRAYPQGALSVKNFLEIAESRAGGGTDFERPLREAARMIKEQGLKKADILLVTDGECAVSDKFLREFLAAKKALEFNVITVLCDIGSSADAAVRQFSDRVEKASAFTADEAEAKIFGHL